METKELDQLSIAIPCPDCSGHFDRTFRWIKDNTKHWCPSCHVEIDLDGTAARHAIGEIQRAIKELEGAVLDFQLSVKN
jgi:hypothetical protein